MNRMLEKLTAMLVCVCLLAQAPCLRAGAVSGAAMATVQWDSSASVGCALSVREGREAVDTQPAGQSVWRLTVPADGEYCLSIDYYPLPGSSAQIKRELTVGHASAMELTFPRVWKDVGEPRFDTQGNEIRAEQQESPCWQTLSAVKLRLSAGEQALTLSGGEEPAAFGQIVCTPAQALPSYDTVLRQWKEAGAKEVPPALTLPHIQAEQPKYKSSQTILTQNDRGSTGMEPYDPSLIRYHSIGGSRWKMQGQWLEWELEAPEDGLYQILLRFRQKEKQNDISSRILYIDGQIPFDEAQRLAFPYQSGWRTAPLGSQDGGEPYLFYLAKGVHVLRLEASLGEGEAVCQAAQELLLGLNEIYLGVVMVTGPSPDVNRDYAFATTIPQTLVKMKEVNAGLQKLEKQVLTLTGQGGQSTAAIRRLTYQLGEMLSDNETIARRLNDFQNNISSLGTWASALQEQPLELDYLALKAPETPTPKAEKGFFASLLHYMCQYIASFQTDYYAVGSLSQAEGKSITVWLGSDQAVSAATVGGTAGRDQSQLIRQMVSDRFTPQSGISVNLQLVNPGSLLPASLAGIGPDAALGLVQSTPVNYALRGAAVDLTRFPDLPQVLTRFSQNAAVPFQLNGGVYALPETLTFPMLFYRRDVLEQLDISLEELETWDSVLQVVLPKLQMKYLEFGVLPTLQTFGMFLYQEGGAFYTEDGAHSALHSPEGIAAFQRMTSLYTEYKQDISFHFVNRFRTGQMPLAIQDFTSYNQLAVFAPEISGLWGMVPVPGLRRGDGGLDRSVAGTVTGCSILSQSGMQQEAWEFLKWWTREDTQTQYSAELEAIMGAAARNPSSNLNTFRSLSWSGGMKEGLLEQFQWVRAIPEVAGGYYTSRHFDFAFRGVTYDGKNIRETLSKAAKDIDSELHSKQEEFRRKGGDGQ